MRHFPSAIAAVSALILASVAAKAESLADLLSHPDVRLSRPDDRARVVARMAEIENARLQEARALATRKGLPLRTVLPNGRVQEIAGLAAGQPLYHATHNVNAAISTGADLLRTSPYSLNGAGVTIGLWDGGSGRATHQEFGGRLIVKDGATSGDHATHVAGTLIATGVNPLARGMADAAVVDSYNWTNDSSEMASRGASYAGEPGAIYLSNHSYGYITGWNYIGTPTRTWEWWGNGTASTSIEEDFGRYNDYSRDEDALAYSAPYYLIFRSAGNERSDNPGTGQSIGLTPGGGATVGYDPSIHPAGDGTYRGGFDNIGFESLSKNVMTVGATTDAVTGGFRDPSVANINSFSSWGPTDDGRIKPDVVANGHELFSSVATSNTAYDTYNGTSMSTPNACGSASLLIQQYGSLFPGQAMRASTLKGLLIHTANDRGNAGPDYKYGWGLVNVKAAADVIRDHHAFPANSRITENQLTTATTTRTHNFTWDGVTPISATLCWTDPAGAANNSTSDDRTPRLVNNLNLKIIAPNGSEFRPYVMPFVGTWTQASMNLPATTGVNNTDNVEQVRIPSPPAGGTYQAVVSFSGALTNGSQNYSLIVTSAAIVVPPPPPFALSGAAPSSGIAGPVTFDLSGTGLRADTVVKLTRTGQSNIAATGVQLIGPMLRCQFNLSGATPGIWNIVATNPDLETSTLPASFTVLGTLWSQNFDSAVSGWTSNSEAGSNNWALTTSASHSPATSYFAAGPSSKSTTNLVSPSIPIPASATNLQFRFWHSYNLETEWDAGKLEFSLNGGTTWFDVEASGSGASFASNGYTTTIRSQVPPKNNNEFAGQLAWSGNSGGFIETIVNLTDTAKYAGSNLRARWRIATDKANASPGWHVDSIALIGDATLPNQPPFITTAASTSSTETETGPGGTVYQVIRGTQTALSLAAADDGGEPSLKYTWSVTSGPAPVTFSANTSNAAKDTNAIFQTAGDYLITVSVLDGGGLSTSSVVNVRVLQTATNLAVTPSSSTVTYGATRQFGATVSDQFGALMAVQPPSFAWLAGGGGTINPSGLFTATAAGGPYVITASSGAVSNTASITVNKAAQTIGFAPLAAVTFGDAAFALSATASSGLEVSHDSSNLSVATVSGNTVTIVGAGSTIITASQAGDANHEAAENVMRTLTVNKATASVTLSNLVQTHDGYSKSVTVTLVPSYLTCIVTYDGSVVKPIAVGSYAVVATVDDPDYEGGATGTLVIEPGNTMAEWKDDHFNEAEQIAGLAAEDADPDSDGLWNLAEYALGTDPRLFTPPLVPIMDENGLTLTFTRPADLPDVVYAAESSGDLGTWSPVPLEVTQEGEPETVRARDPLNSGDPSLRFLRLRFSRP